MRVQAMPDLTDSVTVCFRNNLVIRPDHGNLISIE